MRWVLLTVSSLFILDTLFASGISNPNLGVYLPALLGLPLLVVGLLYRPCLRFFEMRFGLFVKWLLIGGYAAFLAGFIAVCAVLVHAGNAVPQGNADTVIVLGAGLKNGKPSGTLARRLDKALEYANENPETLVVVTGGVGAGQKVSEGQAMAEYLIERGLDDARIRREEKSTSTEENLLYAMEILEEKENMEKGSYRAVVVSTDYHIFRALRVAGRLGLEAEGLSSRSSWYLMPNFYLREYVAVAVYWALGRL